MFESIIVIYLILNIFLTVLYLCIIRDRDFKEIMYSVPNKIKRIDVIIAVLFPMVIIPLSLGKVVDWLLYIRYKVQNLKLIKWLNEPIEK